MRRTAQPRRLRRSVALPNTWLTPLARDLFAAGDRIDQQARSVRDVPRDEHIVGRRPQRVLVTRYSGIPTANIPAGTGSISYTVGRHPKSAKSWAAAKPAGPEPMIATGSPSVLSGNSRSPRNRLSPANSSPARQSRPEACPISRRSRPSDGPSPSPPTSKKRS